MHKLQGFLQLVSANPLLASNVDMRELLQQVWDSGQIGKESPVLDEEKMKQQQNGPQQEIMGHAQQAIDGVKKQAQEAIKQANDQTKAAEEQAAKAGMENQLKEIAHQNEALDARKALMRMEEDLATERIAAKQLQATVDAEREAFRVKELLSELDHKVEKDAERTANEETNAAESKEKSESADAGNSAIAEALMLLAKPKKKTATIKGESGRTWTLEGSETIQ